MTWRRVNALPPLVDNRPICETCGSREFTWTTVESRFRLKCTTCGSYRREPDDE